MLQSEFKRTVFDIILLTKYIPGSAHCCWKDLLEKEKLYYQDSRRAHTKEYFPEFLLPVSLFPQRATANTRLGRRPSNTSSCVTGGNTDGSRTVENQKN